MTIDPASMLALMLLAHLFADFTLQAQGNPCLADLKQKSWWHKQLGSLQMLVEKDLRKYRHDYIVGLVCHSLYWALIVCLPLLACGGGHYLVQSVIQASVHCYIDDQKANRHNLNLVWDQLLHLVQIVAVWCVWLIARNANG